MRHCRKIRRQFNERLDGRLAAGQAGEMEAHLAVCASCRNDWRAYAAAWQSLGALEPIEPSVGFADRTLRRLEQPPEAPARILWIPVLRWAAAATMIAALGLGAWFCWQRLGAGPRVRDQADAELYAQLHETDFLEDLDVIAALDQLRLKENGH